MELSVSLFVEAVVAIIPVGIVIMVKRDRCRDSCLGVRSTARGRKFDAGYRAYIYGSYEHVLGGSFPASVSALAPRKYYLLNLIRRCFPPAKNSVILEIGCGHGALIHFARQAGYRNIEGVDASLGQVNAARNLGIGEVRLMDAMAELETRDSGSVDAIVAIDLLEHHTKEEVWALACEVFRVLRKNGKWIIHVPNAESPFGMAVVYGDFTHEIAFTCASLNQLCRASGFSGIECHDDCPVVHGLASMVRFLAWKMIRGLMRMLLAIETGDAGRRRVLSRNLIAVAVK